MEALSGVVAARLATQNATDNPVFTFNASKNSMQGKIKGKGRKGNRRWRGAVASAAIAGGRAQPRASFVKRESVTREKELGDRVFGAGVAASF